MRTVSFVACLAAVIILAYAIYIIIAAISVPGVALVWILLGAVAATNLAGLALGSLYGAVAIAAGKVDI